MATDKRSLYKRATQDAVVPKDRRKTLAQGRLVTNLTTTVFTTQKDDKQFGEEAFAADQDLDSNIGNKNKVPVKKCLSGSNHSTEPDRGDGFSEEMDVENSTTPRKTVPLSLPCDPSDVAQPTASLDLSETEDEKNEFKGLKDSDASEVIVVDANRKLIALNDTEVDIALHFAHSPAKVIRHTPNKIHGDIRNTGSVERAACIGFDKVPSAVILGDGEIASTRQKQNTSIHKVPIIIRESAIVGQAVDPKSVSLTSSLLTNSSLMVTKSSSMNESAAKSLEKISVSHLEGESSDQVSEFSENDSLSSKDKSNSLSNKAKSYGMTSIEAVSKRPTEKRKVPRIVPSRYLQAASNSKGPIKATDKTFLGSGTGALSGNTDSQRRYNSNSLNRTRHSKPALKKHGSDADLSKRTPHPKAGGQFGASASTPNADETTCFMASNVDVSAIAGLHASNRIGHLQQNVPADVSADLSRIGVPEFDSRLASRHQTKKRSLEESQWSLELLYARHLQWAFLATKARKTLHEQEKQAMEQLRSLAELNRNEDDKIAELESELERLRHTNNVDEALDMQYSGLSCSTSKLPQLREQHHHLAEALDTTRHHIPTKGIYVPDNDAPYLDAIARALQESEHLLGEISVMTRTQAKDIDQCGKVLQAMENVVAREKSELNRCNTLLSAAVTLATQENSLMVQHIQSNQETHDAT